MQALKVGDTTIADIDDETAEILLALAKKEPGQLRSGLLLETTLPQREDTFEGAVRFTTVRSNVKAGLDLTFAQTAEFESYLSRHERHPSEVRYWPAGKW